MPGCKTVSSHGVLDGHSVSWLPSPCPSRPNRLRPRAVHPAERDCRAARKRRRKTIRATPEIAVNKLMSNQAKTTLEEIIKLLHFDDVKVEERQLDDGLLLDLETEDSGRLIGRQGKTLSQLQYLVNRIVFQKDRSAPKITVDVGNYRIKAHEALVSKANDAAEKVRRWGDIVELEPMNAFERRIIHNLLKDDETVETHSVEVEGTSDKAILLRPKQ